MYIINNIIQILFFSQKGEYDLIQVLPIWSTLAQILWARIGLDMDESWTISRAHCGPENIFGAAGPLVGHMWASLDGTGMASYQSQPSRSKLSWQGPVVVLK